MASLKNLIEAYKSRGDSSVPVLLDGARALRSLGSTVIKAGEGFILGFRGLEFRGLGFRV